MKEERFPQGYIYIGKGARLNALGKEDDYKHLLAKHYFVAK